jgi:hypothetical protein
MAPPIAPPMVAPMVAPPMVAPMGPATTSVDIDCQGSMAARLRFLATTRGRSATFGADYSVTRASAKQENRLYAAPWQLLCRLWPSMMYIDPEFLFHF